MNCMVTDCAQFHRAVADGETRYYPANGPENRIAAREFDERTDPVVVGGFAVYDTAVSTAYAVALYSTREDAEKHQPVEVEQAPETAVAEEDPAPVEEEKPSTSKPKKRKFGGKR